MMLQHQVVRPQPLAQPRLRRAAVLARAAAPGQLRALGVSSYGAAMPPAAPWGARSPLPILPSRRNGHRGGAAQRPQRTVRAQGLSDALVGVALFLTPGALIMAYALVKGKGNLADG
jgi:hypothetical protein